MPGDLRSLSLGLGLSVFVLGQEGPPGDLRSLTLGLGLSVFALGRGTPGPMVLTLGMVTEGDSAQPLARIEGPQGRVIGMQRQNARCITGRPLSVVEV